MMNQLAGIREARSPGQNVAGNYLGPNPVDDYRLRYANKLVMDYGPVHRAGRAYVWHPLRVENEGGNRIDPNNRGPGQFQYNPIHSDGFSSAKNYRVFYVRVHNLTGVQTLGSMPLRQWDLLYTPSPYDKRIWHRLREYIDGVTLQGDPINRFISPSDIEMERFYRNKNIPEETALGIQEFLKQSRKGQSRRSRKSKRQSRKR